MDLQVFARNGAERVVQLRSLLPLVSEQAASTWIQIAVEGRWEGHSAGPFEFDRDVFAALVRNFEAQTNPVPLTYEHPSHIGDGQPVVAAGWIHELKIRGTELWAFVEFTPRATQMVRDGEYKFCSVVVGFESTDRKTGAEVGPELFEVGLTNTPFLDGMKPIQLSRARRGAVTKRIVAMSMMKDILKEALKELPDDADVEQVVKFIEASKAKQEAIEGVEEEPKDEEPPVEEMAAPAPVPAPALSADKPVDAVAAAAPAPAAPPVQLEDMPGDVAADPAAEDAAAQSAAAGAVQAVADALGTDLAGATAALQENLDAVVAACGGTAAASGTVADQPTVAGMARDAGKARIAALTKQVADRDANVKALSDRIAALEDAALQRRISDAVEAGHVLDGDREKFVKLGRKDPGLLDEFLGEAAKNPAVPSAPYKMSKPASRLDDVSDIDRDSDEYKAIVAAARLAGMKGERLTAFADKRFKTLTERSSN